jgi:uncharacterized cupin superfamily protein
MAEAPLEKGEAGKVPAGKGWFIVNLAEAEAMDSKRFGLAAAFEGPERDFERFGVNVRVLEPGQPASMYHREASQEAFLVLAGECVAIVEGEERSLRKGDFLHMPSDVPHVIVGAGDGPSTVLMVGSRAEAFNLSFPVDAAAAAYGASVDEETQDRQEAYAGTPPPAWTTLGIPW